MSASLFSYSWFLSCGLHYNGETSLLARKPSAASGAGPVSVLLCRWDSPAAFLFDVSCLLSVVGRQCRLVRHSPRLLRSPLLSRSGLQPQHEAVRALFGGSSLSMAIAVPVR